MKKTNLLMLLILNSYSQKSKMKMRIQLLIACLVLINVTYAQQAIYEVTVGNGNGIRFWQNDLFKIHMGTGSEYQYGPVTDYSIKMNMSNDAARGWTWGISGQSPVAALSNAGHMQLAGTLTTMGNVKLASGAKVAFNNVDINTSQLEGITWYNADPSYYGIYRTAGSWTAPNYQQLKLGFTTGIILDPGSAYGKSYVDIQGGGLRVTSGSVGIGTITPGTKLDLNGNFQVYPSANAGTSGALKLRIVPGSSATIIEANSDNAWANHDVIINAANSSGGNTNQLVVHRGGNIALGHNNPYSHSRLHVKAPSVSPWAILAEANTNDRVIGMSHDGTKGIVAVSSFGSGFSPLELWTSNLTRMTIAVDGKVGIGTTNPSEKLTVNGTIYGTKVKVDLTVPGPDYVFEKEYTLPSLQEIKSYIDQNKRLPEVPSAKEMEANGINVGEMNMLLLKKVEELTLYIIEQQKQINELQKAIKKD